MAKLNIDLDDLTPEAKAELSKYIRTCAKQEIKRVLDELRRSLKNTGFQFVEITNAIKEICDEA